jgi:hypothetical protein
MGMVKAHDLGIDWLSAGGASRSTWKGNFCPGRFGSIVVEHLIKLLGASKSSVSKLSLSQTLSDLFLLSQIPEIWLVSEGSRLLNG